MGRRSRRARRSGAVALALAGGLAGGGCATSRWVDERVPGDLWGTAGRELGAVELLRAGGPGERAAGDAERSDGAEAALDLLVELILQGLAVW